jgi:hypothetical protein
VKDITDFAGPVLVGALVGIAWTMWLFASSAECKAQHGVFVRTAFWFECVKPINTSPQ